MVIPQFMVVHFAGPFVAAALARAKQFAAAPAASSRCSLSRSKSEFMLNIGPLMRYSEGI